MKFSRFFILFIVMINSFSAFGQKMINGVIWPETGKNDTILVSATNENGYMIPWIGLKEVKIYGKRTFRTPADEAAYNRLRYNVLKVLPYAKYARDRYQQLERDLAVTSDKRKQRKLVKQCDDEIKKLFNTEIKELTITQGKILTKLIDRELNQSTYDIVRETKGKFAAFSYQLIARVVGHNLKTTYNPNEERDIENIIRSVGYY